MPLAQFYRLNARTRPWGPQTCLELQKQCLENPVVTKFPGFHLTQKPKGLYNEVGHRGQLRAADPVLASGNPG